MPKGFTTFNSFINLGSTYRDGDNNAYVPLELMMETVTLYIYQERGVIIRISPPRNDRELQLLGRAYDIATGKEVRAL